MHYVKKALGSPGDAVGMHLKGLDRSAVIPRSGDVAIGASGNSLGAGVLSSVMSVWEVLLLILVRADAWFCYSSRLA